MSLLAKNKTGTDFEPLSAGMHHAVCYGVVDLGTQPSNNPNFKPSHKVAFLWEIPSERIQFERDGKRLDLPRSQSSMFSLTLASKGLLRPMLESWRGRAFTADELDGFDLKNVLTANCFLNIVHAQGKGQNAGKTYANVASVNPLAKGMAKLMPENETIFFSIEECQGNIEIPPEVPEWLAAKIMQSEEYIRSKNEPSHGPTDDELSNPATPEELQDSVPF